MKRRTLFKASLGLGLGSVAGSTLNACAPEVDEGALVISTWEHGQQANEEAWKLLSKGGDALTAAEKGVRVVESDPNVRTVGIGGFPDREGKVTLDACIMDGQTGLCGSVAFLQDIENPISVARMVMEKTPHVMLVGAGAKQFALENGFEEKDLLTDASKRDYENWLKTSEYKPVINIENHDTIGLLTRDANGNLAGACTTSGAAYKMHGRVGDSPLIAAGLFVDNEIGAATATGLGEVVIRSAGCAMVVEAMRHGMSPQEACEEIVDRISKKEKSVKDLQVGFIAINKAGEIGAYSLHGGFNYAVKSDSQDALIDAVSRY
ncbi:MAG: N(4)-(beta-N-acetylglucosaminyl)-L-asparaginase [Cytophagales bacterium]|nr:N(4)-(beta-N-acetylglucosaminyl)-L-asparaginase [Cytophagales bacterium]